VCDVRRIFTELRGSPTRSESLHKFAFALLVFPECVGFGPRKIATARGGREGFARKTSKVSI
jgi:hypothetical protein